MKRGLESLRRYHGDDVESSYYEWQEGFHNGRFRWRRHPTLYDRFMAGDDSPFWSDMVYEGKNYGRVYYPAIWQIQRWDSDKNDWGDIQGRIELPGMD